MPRSPLLFVVAFGCALPLLVACSGRALEGGASAGSAGSDESTAGAGASSGAAGASAGASPGGATGVAGGSAHAGAAGAAHEPENHRPSAVACDQTRPTNDPGAPADQDGGYVACHSHADCTAGKNGRCSGNGHDGWQCTYDGCFADSDCSNAASGEPQLCACGEGFRSDNNVCLAGNCRVDTDCGQGGYCSPTLGDCGNYAKTVGYYCHTKDDECSDDSDCKAGTASGPGYCAFTPSVGHWRCSTAQCVG